MDELETTMRFYFLHCVRCAAMIGPISAFGQGGGARMAKLALGIGLGVIAGLQGDLESFRDPQNSLVMVVLTANEMLVGALFGYVVNVAFAAVRVAGHMLGTEMGFNMASIQDPITGTNVQVIALLFESFATILFFAAKGHHTLLRALVLSFERYRVGEPSFGPELIESAVVFTSGLFVAAFELAAPILVAMIIAGVALAILSKVAPQLQVMQFAFSFKIVLGLALLVMLFPVLVPSMQSVFDRLEIYFHEITAG